MKSVLHFIAKYATSINSEAYKVWKMMIRGKRELLAHGLYWSGTTLLFDRLPARDMLLVLNYHRIGNPDDDLFDPGVFSATGDQLNEHISSLKKAMSRW